MYKSTGLTFAIGSLVGVGWKLVQFVAYCVLFVMMSTNIEKNSAVSEEGHVLTSYGFFLVVSLASMQIKSFWNPYKSGLKLKIYIDPSSWPAGSAVRIKKKRPKGKIVFKKETKQKKKRYKETENSVAGSRIRFICTFKQLLDHCTTVTHMIWKFNFVISKQFFSAIDAVWSWWSCIYHEFKYTFEEN